MGIVVHLAVVLADLQWYTGACDHGGIGKAQNGFHTAHIPYELWHPTEGLAADHRTYHRADYLSEL